MKRLALVLALALLLGGCFQTPGHTVLQAEAGYVVALNAASTAAENGLLSAEDAAQVEFYRSQAYDYLKKARVALRADMGSEADDYAEFALRFILQMIAEVPDE